MCQPPHVVHLYATGTGLSARDLPFAPRPFVMRRVTCSASDLLSNRSLPSHPGSTPLGCAALHFLQGHFPGVVCTHWSRILATNRRLSSIPHKPAPPLRGFGLVGFAHVLAPTHPSVGLEGPCDKHRAVQATPPAQDRGACLDLVAREDVPQLDACNLCPLLDACEGAHGTQLATSCSSSETTPQANSR